MDFCLDGMINEQVGQDVQEMHLKTGLAEKILAIAVFRIIFIHFIWQILY